MKTGALYIIFFFSLFSKNYGQDSSAFKNACDSYIGGKFEDAIFWFSKSIEQKYRQSDSYRYMGISNAFLKKFNDARNNLFYSLLLDSTNERTYNQIGKFYFLKEQYDSAIIWYTKAIDSNPNDVYFYDDRALAYTGANQLDKALKDANIAVSLDPNNEVFLNNRGLIKQKQLKYNEALKDFSRVLQIDSSMANNLSTYINIAFCHLRLKEYQKSFQECNDILFRFPNTPYALMVRGLLYQTQQKRKESCADFNLLYSLDTAMGKEYIEKYCNSN